MMTSVAFPLLTPVAIGAACGCGTFFLSVTSQKICMLAGVKFEEKAELLGIDIQKEVEPVMNTWLYGVALPIGLELVMRGLLQPFLSKGFLLFMPRLAAPALLGITRAHICSVVAIGTGIGILNYCFLKSGAKQSVFIATVHTVALGIVKERFGLVSSVSAFVMDHFILESLYKHYRAPLVQAPLSSG